MGNTFKSSNGEEPPGPGEEVGFFRGMNIRWMNVFIQKIRDAKRADFSVSNAEETLQWSDYFTIFTEIKETMATEARVKERLSWHTATIGYAMMKRTEVEEEAPLLLPPLEAKQPDEGYTDDEPSEADEDDVGEGQEGQEGEGQEEGGEGERPEYESEGSPGGESEKLRVLALGNQEQEREDEDEDTPTPATVSKLQLSMIAKAGSVLSIGSSDQSSRYA
jgi:hypothetical protein